MSRSKKPRKLLQAQIVGQYRSVMPSTRPPKHGSNTATAAQMEGILLDKARRLARIEAGLEWKRMRVTCTSVTEAEVVTQSQDPGYEKGRKFIDRGIHTAYECINTKCNFFVHSDREINDRFCCNCCERANWSKKPPWHGCQCQGEVFNPDHFLVIANKADDGGEEVPPMPSLAHCDFCGETVRTSDIDAIMVQGSIKHWCCECVAALGPEDAVVMKKEAAAAGEQ